MKRALFMLALIAGLFAAAGCESGKPRDGSSGSLLAGATLRQAVGARMSARLTDGVLANPGDPWRTDLTGVLDSSNAFVEYDLGTEKQICCADLQADANDLYTLSVSSDGQTFTRLWDARPTPGTGLQTRSTDRLDAMARYVRIAAEGGDGRFGIAEVELYSERPAVFPPDRRTRAGIPVEVGLRTRILGLGLALAWVTAFAFGRGRARWLTALSMLALAAALWSFGRSLIESWPIGGIEVSLIRAVAAGIACLVVVREVWSARSNAFLPDRRVLTVLLSISAGLALASFYNFGHPQFTDHRTGRARFIHDYDMRVYYPAAKYWRELHYDGVYLASAAAYLEDQPGASADFQLRNLRDFNVQKLSELRGEMQAVRGRFSPARWDAFKSDMRYFRATMGVHDYLGTLLDHGANATPLWMTSAHLLFGFTRASDTTLMIGALLDPLLLAIAFIAIGRSFGLRTALLSMVIFGATDFYLTGSNWAGSTLRHDWLALSALGICALAKERWRTGGALLMLAAMIRAFPALAVIGACLPAAGWLLLFRYREQKFPSLSLWRSQQKPLLQVLLGALACGILAFALSSAVSGLHAWPDWLVRTRVFNESGASNEISLRVLLSGGEGYAPRLLAERAVLRGALLIGFVVSVALIGRKLPLHSAATLALFLTPILFNPTNYYLHFIFLVPLLVRARVPKAEDAAIAIAVLLMCSLQYLVVTDKDELHHFWVETCLYMLWLMVTLLVLAFERGSERSDSRELPPAFDDV